MDRRQAIAAAICALGHLGCGREKPLSQDYTPPSKPSVELPAEDSVSLAWRRLERWYGEKCPAMLKNLNPGVTEAQLADFEKAIGQRLPADVRRSFLLHNGQDPNTPGLIFGLYLLPLSDALNEWRSWRKIDKDNNDLKTGAKSYPSGAVQLDYANPAWIPLTHDHGSGYLGVDLAPAAKGSKGQVITFGRNDEGHLVAASSWADFLTQLAGRLEAGKYALDKEGRLRAGAHFHTVLYREYLRLAGQ